MEHTILFSYLLTYQKIYGFCSQPFPPSRPLKECCLHIKSREELKSTRRIPRELWTSRLHPAQSGCDALGPWQTGNTENHASLPTQFYPNTSAHGFCTSPSQLVSGRWHSWSRKIGQKNTELIPLFWFSISFTSGKAKEMYHTQHKELSLSLPLSFQESLGEIGQVHPRWEQVRANNVSTCLPVVSLTQTRYNSDFYGFSTTLLCNGKVNTGLMKSTQD